MHDMEEGVVKKKSSSGCLIIKKKGDGIGGFGASASKKVFESTKEKNNKKKRPRSIINDTGSSDELLEPIRRKVVSGTKKFRNGSAVQKKGFVENSSISKSDRMESERKRSGLDVFEFDEYDGYDGKKMRKDYMDDRLKLSGIGSSRNAMIDKKKHSLLGGKSKGNRHEIEEDEAHLPISLLREKYRKASDEPIRLQGKNGVLKVMVNKQKKLGLSRKSYDHQEDEDRKGSRSEDAVKKNVVIRPSFYSDSKHAEKRVSFVKTQKSELKLRKSLSIKSSKAGESETDDSNVSLKLGSTSKQGRSSTKKVEKEGKTTPQTENITPIRGKEGQVKRGTGTEKQLLREKIRSMLLDVGWTIDYRPRRNRDYLDAVYISPTGTAYWSIIKAYDALQKQLEEDDNDIKPCGDSSPFTPLPEEILSKLTRQTRKKIERERKMKMKMKRRGDGGSKNATVKEFVVGTDSGQQEEKLSSYMKQNRQSRKGRLREADHASGDDSSEKPSIATNSDMIQGRKSRTVGRCTFFIRSSDKGLNSVTDGSVPYTGKRTLLAWLIDSGVVHMSEKVQYMNRRKTRAMLEGWITRDGIHCGCCSKILTISKFEIHAGSKQRHPYPNIFLESGLSLMQCQIEAWNSQEESKRQGFHTVDTDGDDPDDDTCGLCGDGGDLICCDGCPSTFHLSCLDIQMLPPGDWHCPNCTCKFCGIGGGSIAEANGRTSSELLVCNLCEKKYHELCRQEIDDLPVDSSNATTFCGQTCQELFSHLQKLLGVKHELEGGFSWSLIHRMDPVSDMLHLGFSQRVECNSKLAVALSVMDECFLPIVDRRSGINLMHNVVYNCGSNFSRLNYSGFYTAILERGDEIISAASIRIHGTQLAEMPFIGTRHIYRRRGMCRRLLRAIELVLCSLKVEKLIIPAIAEHMHTWTEVFNFNPLEELHKQEMRSINMLVFPGTDMLQKLLVKREIPNENITANSDAKSIEVKENHPLLPILAKKTELDSSGGHGLDTCNDGVVQHVNEINDKVDVIDSGLQAPVLPSNESVESSSSADPPCEPILQFPNKEIISINSQSVNKLAESTSDLKCLSPSDASPVILEIGNPVMDPPVDDNIESSAEGVVGDAHEVRAKASCIGSVLGSLGETSARNLAEANENQNSVSVSTINHADENDSALQAPALPSNESAVSVGSSDPPCEPILQFPNKEIISINSQSVNKPAESTSELKCLSPSDASPVILEIGNPVMDPPVEDNIESSAECVVGDAHEVSAKASCIGSVLGSLGETSARNLAEANKNQNSVSVSTVNHTDEKSAVKINFDLDHHIAVEMERKVGVASDVPSDAEVASVESNIQSLPEGSKQDVYDVNLKVASDSNVASVEVKIQSFAVGDGDNHEAQVGSVESALFAQNSTDEIYENCNPVSASTLCDTDEGTIQLNSDLNNQNATEMESKLPVASECGSEAKAAPVENNTHEIDANVTSVEPVPDSLQGIFVNSTVEEITENQNFILANNTVEEITENENLISDCTFHGGDEIPIGFNQDLHRQTSIKVVSDLTVASKVVSDEVVAPSDTKIQSIGENEAGDAHEVSVEEASVELVRDSIGATSSQNGTTPAINENLRSSCGSDENGIQIKFVSDHDSAIEIESELHVATEIASSAMHRESDIR